MRKLTDVFISMPDGVRLAGDVYLPDQEGSYPALLTLLPYGKGLQSFQIDPPQAIWDPLWCSTIESGHTQRLIDNGYVHIIVDVRGTGHSEGVYNNMFSEAERSDGYHVVEWMAQQSWCDGSIGMFGTSYLAMAQYFVAASRPPHLKAIFPFRGLTDIYRELSYHGGLPELGFFNPNFWSLIDVGTTGIGTPPEELDALLDEALKNPDLAADPFIYGILLNWKRNPVLFDFLLHPYDGPFYQQRSAISVLPDIEVPSYVGAVWTDTYLHLGGAFTAWRDIQAPKRLLIGPRQPKRPFVEYHTLMIRWFDHWLKGIDNGVMNDPPILLWCGGKDEWRWEQEWPLQRTQWERYYLHTRSQLSTDVPAEDGRDEFIQLPARIQGAGPQPKLTYETAPFERDVELTGPIALTLYAEIDASDTHWIARLFDVGGGAVIELTQGFLRASHRQLDQTHSTDGQPYHSHTREAAQPVPPGEICIYDIALLPISRVFASGHRLRLEISSSDFSGTYPNRHHFHHLPVAGTVTHRVAHGQQHPSHLLVPVIPADHVDRSYHGPDPLS
jgi:uncharacterized protein